MFFFCPHNGLDQPIIKSNLFISLVIPLESNTGMCWKINKSILEHHLASLKKIFYKFISYDCSLIRTTIKFRAEILLNCFLGNDQYSHAENNNRK